MADLTNEEVFQQMRELNKDNPEMLLWIAGAALATRVNPNELPVAQHPGPVSDTYQQYLVNGTEDEQYLAEIEKPAAWLTKNKNKPHEERMKDPYRG